VFRIEVTDVLLRTLDLEEGASLLKLHRSHRRLRWETAGDHPYSPSVDFQGRHCQRSPFDFTFAGRLNRPKCCGTLDAARFCVRVQLPAVSVGLPSDGLAFFQPRFFPCSFAASACRFEPSRRRGCPCSSISNPVVACAVTPLADESSSF
jgi:hypothetical protein